MTYDVRLKSLRIFAFILIASWINSLNASSLSSRLLRVEDLDQIILEKNEEVEVAKVQLHSQEARMGKLRRSFIPQLFVKMGAENFQTDIQARRHQEYWKLGINLNLYRGHRDDFEERIRESTLGLRKSELKFKFLSELKEARSTYWKIIALTQFISLRKEVIDKIKIYLSSAKRRAGVGLVTSADTVQFELYQVSIEREISQLELERDLNLNRLSVLMGLDDHYEINLVSDFPKVKFREESLSKFEGHQYLEVKMQDEIEKIERLKSDQAANWWHPKIDLYASYGLPSLSDDFDSARSKIKEMTAGVVLTFDLGQGFEDRAEELAKRADYRAAQVRSKSILRRMNATDHELKHDLKTLGALIQSVDGDIALAERLMKLTIREYDRGVKNGPDLLSAIQTYFEFKNKKTEYYRDYHLSLSELESLGSVSDF